MRLIRVQPFAKIYSTARAEQALSVKSESGGASLRGFLEVDGTWRTLPQVGLFANGVGSRTTRQQRHQTF
jgi:hypothetical protein